jgi:hypothetical protein
VKVNMGVFKIVSHSVVLSWNGIVTLTAMTGARQLQRSINSLKCRCE